jgi:hypothetical protein
VGQKKSNKNCYHERMPETIAKPAPAARTSVLQSPWYWAYAFCAAGLIALVLLGGKVAQRQSQIERQHQGRQRAMARSTSAGALSPQEFSDSALSTPEATIITLEPLYVILATALVVSWAVLWWTHFRRKRSREAP